MNDMNRDAEAGAEPQQRAGVLRDFRLIERQFHRHDISLLKGRQKWLWV